MDDATQTAAALPPRPPLRAGELQRALVHPGGLWRKLMLTEASASTNTELVAAARDGAPEGTILVTEHQTQGRGRIDRSFHTPPRAALTVSVFLRPQVPPARLGWLPLLMGLAVVRAVRDTAKVEVGLKWPNDVLTLAVLAGEQRHKLVGILAEAAATAQGTGVVLGVGMNVSQTRAELPVATATSLAAAGGQCLDREQLLGALLDEFAELYRSWTEHRGDTVAAGIAGAYVRECLTIGQEIRVHLPTGETLAGTAVDVDPEGRLVVQVEDGTTTALSAGDVVHVRPMSAAGN